VKLSSCTLRTVGQKFLTPKIARRKHAKSSITQRLIIRFRSNFVQSLSTRIAIKVQGQEVKDQGTLGENYQASCDQSLYEICVKSSNRNRITDNFANL